MCGVGLFYLLLFCLFVCLFFAVVLLLFLWGFVVVFKEGVKEEKKGDFLYSCMVWEIW